MFAFYQMPELFAMGVAGLCLVTCFFNPLGSGIFCEMLAPIGLGIAASGGKGIIGGLFLRGAASPLPSSAAWWSPVLAAFSFAVWSASAIGATCLAALGAWSASVAIAAACSP